MRAVASATTIFTQVESTSGRQAISARAEAPLRTSSSSAAPVGRRALALQQQQQQWRQQQRASTLVAMASLQGANGVVGSRQATVQRETKETNVEVTIDVDGTGVCNASTQIGFLDHMLDQLVGAGGLVWDFCMLKQ